MVWQVTDFPEPDSPTPNDFLFVDGEADVVHRPGRACSGMEMSFQILLRRASSSIFGGNYVEGVQKPVAEKIKEKRVREKKRPGSRSS